MLPKKLIEGFDRIRLRNFLGLFFLALAVPTAILIWQAYSQLKWEAFHQYRGVAEELTQRIDARLNAMIRSADARSFADYTFLVVSGDPSANFVQRSPLSAYPVTADLPGVMGYFQVDSNGDFSSPVLPPEGAEAGSLGISETEYRNRLQLARQLQAVLADNRLLKSRLDVGFRRDIASSIDAPSTASAEENERDVVGGFMAAAADKDAGESYSQQVFDQLNQPRQRAGYESGSAARWNSTMHWARRTKHKNDSTALAKSAV